MGETFSIKLTSKSVRPSKVPVANLAKVLESLDKGVRSELSPMTGIAADPRRLESS